MSASLSSPAGRASLRCGCASVRPLRSVDSPAARSPPAADPRAQSDTAPAPDRTHLLLPALPQPLLLFVLFPLSWVRSRPLHSPPAKWVLIQPSAGRRRLAAARHLCSLFPSHRRCPAPNARSATRDQTAPDAPPTAAMNRMIQPARPVLRIQYEAVFATCANSRERRARFLPPGLCSFSLSVPSTECRRKPLR